MVRHGSKCNVKAAAAAAELQNLIISNGFTDSTDFHVFQILFINFDAILGSVG